MNLAKSLDVFSPHDVKGRIHIIGCGSVGSTIAELLEQTVVDALAFGKAHPL